MSTKVGDVTQRAMEIVKRSLHPERKETGSQQGYLCNLYSRNKSRMGNQEAEGSPSNIGTSPCPLSPTWNRLTGYEAGSPVLPPRDLQPPTWLSGLCSHILGIAEHSLLLTLLSEDLKHDCASL